MKSITSCRAGNCTNFAAFLCRNCGSMMCRQHYNTSKSLCLACAASSGGYGGCLVALVGLAVLIGIVVLIAGKNTGQSSSPRPVPYIDVTLSADNAQHAGKFDGNIPGFLDTDQYPNGMRSGATLTFTGIRAPINGTYTIHITADARITSKPSYTLDINVNGKTQATLPINNVYAVSNSTKINLQQGDNTIQLQLKGDDVYVNYGTTDEPNSVSSCVNIDKIEVTGDGSRTS